MTPAQLAHLAEQAEFAAGFFKATNPSAADRFTQCAAAARQLAKNMERMEGLNRIRSELVDISKRIERRTRLDSHAPVPAVDHGLVDVDGSGPSV
jgi:hypothetical protein